MTISIIKKHIKSFALFFIGLPMVCCSLVAFSSYPFFIPSPPIKKKVHKVFRIEDKQTLLDDYTETKYNIHGDIIEFAEYFENEDKQIALKKLKVIKYNREGLYLGSLVYNHDNVLVWTEENTYNSTEQVIQVTQTDYGDNPIETNTFITYDEQGNINLSKTFDNKGNQVSERRRSYMESGELLSAIDWYYIRINSKPIKKQVTIDNQYNINGQIKQSTKISQEGRTKLKDVKQFKNSAVINWMKYENGRLVSNFKHQIRDTTAALLLDNYELPAPIPYQTVPLEYDDAKRDPLENIPHSPITTVTTKTNKQGLTTKKVVKNQNQITSVTYYYYDTKQLLKSEKTYDKITRDIEEILYEYDQYGNPTLKSIFFNEVLTDKHSFSYEYYRH